MKSTYIKNTLIFAVLLLAFVSCKKDVKPELSAQQQRQLDISNYSQQLTAETNTIPDRAKADTLITMFSDYINDYPEDTISEYYLYLMANVYANINDCKNSIDCLNRLIQKYPKGNYVGAAYFFKGVFYKDVCDNKEKSIEAFNEYIEKYPDNPHVEDAKMLMKMDSVENPDSIIKNVH